MSKLTRIREKRCLTQREVAAQLQVSETTLRNWEHGRAGLYLFKKVSDLCRVLDCSVHDLVEDADNA